MAKTTTRRARSSARFIPQILRTVGIDRTFPYQFPGLMPEGGLQVGLGGGCDPAQANVRARLQPQRYARGAFIGVVAAAGGDIVFTAGQDLVLFENGTDGTGTGLGAVTLTDSETNAENDGGVAKGFAQFVAEGLGVEPVQPWFSDTGNEPAEDIILAPWLFDTEARYDVLAQRGIFNNASMTITNGDDACVYGLGGLSKWPQISGVGEVRNGLSGPAGSFLFFSTMQVSGSAKSSEELNVTVTLDRTITIQSNILAPTEAGQVVVPFDVALIGYPQCVVAEPDQRVLVMLLRQEAKMRKMARKLNVDIDDDDDVTDEELEVEVLAKQLAAAKS